MPSGLKANHTASIIPAKAKFAIKNPPAARSKSFIVCILNAAKSISRKHTMRSITDEKVLIFSTKTVNEYIAPIAEEINFRQPGDFFPINRVVADSIRKFTSKFISKSISTYITSLNISPPESG